MDNQQPSLDENIFEGSETISKESTLKCGNGEHFRKLRFYSLEFPIGNIRYVGKTIKELTIRLSNHIGEAKLLQKEGTRTSRFNSKKNRWILGLLKRGEYPIINLLEEMDYTENWEELEKNWIYKIKQEGFKLLNMTDGGIGNKNQYISKKSLLKRGESLRGRKRPKDVCKKISESKKGSTIPQEVRDKISQTLKKRNLEARMKI